MIKKIIFVLLLSSGLYADLFEKSNMNFGVAIGGGSVVTEFDGTQNYTIVGMNVDYFFIDNLSLGFGYMGWFGASPTLNQLTIPATYYVPLHNKIRPYFGGFIRETFVSGDYENYESYGGKVGIAVTLSPNSYMGAGWIMEYSSSCGGWQENCTNSYPEFIFAFSF